MPRGRAWIEGINIRVDVHPPFRAAALTLLGCLALSRSSAADEEAPRGALHIEAGRPVIGGILGVGLGNGKTSMVAGLSIGVPPISGVLPGVRGVVIASETVSGEVAATLTLAPPISWSVVPFALFEIGRRILPDDEDGWLYGAGGGLFIGEPRAAVSLQVGWMYRRLSFSELTLDASGPIVGISMRL